MQLKLKKAEVQEQIETLKAEIAKLEKSYRRNVTHV